MTACVLEAPSVLTPPSSRPCHTPAGELPPPTTGTGDPESRPVLKLSADRWIKSGARGCCQLLQHTTSYRFGDPSAGLQQGGGREGVRAAAAPDPRRGPTPRVLRALQGAAPMTGSDTSMRRHSCGSPGQAQGTAQQSLVGKLARDPPGEAQGPVPSGSRGPQGRAGAAGRARASSGTRQSSVGVCAPLSTQTACTCPSRGHLCIFVGVFTHATLTCPCGSPALSCIPAFHSPVIRHPQWPRVRVLGGTELGPGVPPPPAAWTEKEASRDRA